MSKIGLSTEKWFSLSFIWVGELSQFSRIGQNVCVFYSEISKVVVSREQALSNESGANPIKLFTP